VTGSEMPARSIWQSALAPAPIALLTSSLVPSILIVALMECVRANVVSKSAAWPGTVIAVASAGVMVAPIAVGLLIPRMTGMSRRIAPTLIVSAVSFSLNLAIIVSYIALGRMN